MKLELHAGQTVAMIILLTEKMKVAEKVVEQAMDKEVEWRKGQQKTIRSIAKNRIRFYSKFLPWWWFIKRKDLKSLMITESLRIYYDDGYYWENELPIFDKYEKALKLLKRLKHAHSILKDTETDGEYPCIILEDADLKIIRGIDEII